MEAAAAQPSKPKKRKVRDPNAPKKPANVFFIYSQSMRDKVKEEHKEMSKQEINKELGNRWKSMSNDEKQVWPW